MHLAIFEITESRYPQVWTSYNVHWFSNVLQIVNFGSNVVNLTIRATGLQAGVNTKRSRVTVLTSGNVLDENSFSNPNNVRGWMFLDKFVTFI